MHSPPAKEKNKMKTGGCNNGNPKGGVGKANMKTKNKKVQARKVKLFMW